MTRREKMGDCAFCVISENGGRSFVVATRTEDEALKLVDFFKEHGMKNVRLAAIGDDGVAEFDPETFKGFEPT